MDRCTRVTSKDTLTHNSKESCKSHTVHPHKEQKKLTKAWQACWKAAEREEGIETHLFAGNPSTSSVSPTQPNAMEGIQMNSLSPSVTDIALPSIDDLCTQLESLMLNEWEKVVNCLHIAQGEPYSQLVQSAWRRKSNAGSIYLSIWKSMQLHVFIHLTHKQDEAAALLDSGATKNFIQESYAQQLKLSIKWLPYTQPVYNVNGMLNKNGHIHSYTNLEMQMGQQRTKLCFFLTDIGEQKLILGYLWFTATQPNINWAQGWIEADQLPLIICTPEKKVCIGKCSTTPVGRCSIKHPYAPANGLLYIAWIQIPGKEPSTSKKQTLA